MVLDELLALERTLERRASLRRQLRVGAVAAVAFATAAVAAWWLRAG